MRSQELKGEKIGVPVVPKKVLVVFKKVLVVFRRFGEVLVVLKPCELH